MLPMYAIINAFLSLRDRGIKDPLYARFVLRKDGQIKARGWLWRQRDCWSKDLQSGEEFLLSVETTDGQSAEVVIRWEPMFHARVVNGSSEERQLVLWFLHQGPALSGGSHEEAEEESEERRSWNESASDFYVIRLGQRFWHGSWIFRQPSQEAKQFVADPKRFQVDDRVRQRVQQVMGRPLPNGEWVTIRRVF